MFKWKIPNERMINSHDCGDTFISGNWWELLAVPRSSDKQKTRKSHFYGGISKRFVHNWCFHAFIWRLSSDIRLVYSTVIHFAVCSNDMIFFSFKSNSTWLNSGIATEIQIVMALHSGLIEISFWFQYQLTANLMRCVLYRRCIIQSSIYPLYLDVRVSS